MRVRLSPTARRVGSGAGDNRHCGFRTVPSAHRPRQSSSAPPFRTRSNDPGVPFIEKVERHYFSERFPFEPFGDPFDHFPEMREKQRKRREAARRQADAASPPSLKAEL